MAVTSLATWDPPLLNRCIACSSSNNLPRWNSRQFSLPVHHHRKLSKLQKSYIPIQTLSSESLRYIDERQVFKKWLGGQAKRTRSVFWNAAVTRGFQVFCIVTEKIVGGSQFSASADQSVRRIILLRHAKSSWSDRSIKDHERPLSRRGRQAAANIALKLQECAGWEPQLILCSDSTRTRETLEIMQQQAEYMEGEVQYFSSFYSVAAMDGQTVQHLQEIICKHSKDDVTTIMCMGHNRGWEEAASLLSGVCVELKTANAALLESRGSSWQEAFERSGLGGWKLVGVVKPDPSIVEEGAVQ